MLLYPGFPYTLSAFDRPLAVFLASTPRPLSLPSSIIFFLTSTVILQCYADYLCMNSTLLVVVFFNFDNLSICFRACALGCIFIALFVLLC